MDQSKIEGRCKIAENPLNQQFIYPNNNYIPHASCPELPVTQPISSIHSRIHLNLGITMCQVFGCNTDVGKTIISAALTRACIQDSEAVSYYIKPIQTGETGWDADFVHKSCMYSDRVTCETLFAWKSPVSPHLAAIIEQKPLGNEHLLQKLQKYLDALTDRLQGKKALVLIETAGGVCSPAPSASIQADVYRYLRLPVVLVGDGKLGGISTTLSAVDSLLIRGYDIIAIVIIEQAELDNSSAIAMSTRQHGIPVVSFPGLPSIDTDLDLWYKSVETTSSALYQTILKYQRIRKEGLSALEERAKAVIWWPFTQHQNHSGVTVIDSAYGDTFITYNKGSNSLESVFDGCGSWWTQGVGHGNTKISHAIAYTNSRYGHVMFPDNAHEPAIRLAEKLIHSEIGEGWAAKVFFSDDGSTAVEVAIKMALRKYVKDHGGQSDSDLFILAQTNCYHGDTLGAMNVANPSIFNFQQQPWYSPKGVFVDPPSISCRNGKLSLTIPGYSLTRTFMNYADIFDSERDAAIDELYRKIVKDSLTSCRGRIGAALVEPVLMGAGGMIFVDPFFQQIIVQECRHRRIPVIYDEVFSGCYRLGVPSARIFLREDPDIGCYSKLLTGGTVPLAVTLASQEVFDAFLGDSKGEALLHGHSYTANPIACVAAIVTLDIFNHVLSSNSLNTYWDRIKVAKISEYSTVRRSFCLGTVFAFELNGSQGGYAANDAQSMICALRTEGIFARPLGNTIYLMCSPLTTTEACSKLLDATIRILSLVKPSASEQFEKLESDEVPANIP